jgi:hypothetical protein
MAIVCMLYAGTLLGSGGFGPGSLDVPWAAVGPAGLEAFPLHIFLSAPWQLISSARGGSNPLGELTAIAHLA